MNDSITMLLSIIPLAVIAMFILLKNEGDLLDKMHEERKQKLNIK